jgi:hypothetical protein
MPRSTAENKVFVAIARLLARFAALHLSSSIFQPAQPFEKPVLLKLRWAAFMSDERDTLE